MLAKVALAWAVFTLFVGLTCVWASVPPENLSRCEAVVHGSQEEAFDRMISEHYQGVALVRSGVWCLN